MTTAEIIAQCVATLPRPSDGSGGYRTLYVDEKNGHTRKIFAKNGAETITVAVAGFKLLVTFHGTTLVSIQPRAMSAGRGEYCIYPYNDRDSWVEDGYFSDGCARPKTGAACDIAYAAWVGAAGDIQAFYRALGKRGYCAICGAGLTDELSQARGIGPECYKHLGVGRAGLHDVKAWQAMGGDKRVEAYAAV